MADRLSFSQALMQRVAQLTQSFTVYNREGFQVNEVLRFFFEGVDSLSSLGMQYMGMDPEKQKFEVVEALRAVYMAKNPDIPWITEPFESMVEQALFNYVIPELYTVLVERKKRVRQAGVTPLMGEFEVQDQMVNFVSSYDDPLGQRPVPTVSSQPLVR